MHLISRVLNRDISCLFLNSVPLFCKINLGHKVLDRISFMYAIDTASAVLVFRGTVVRYEVNKPKKIVHVYGLLMMLVGAQCSPHNNWQMVLEGFPSASTGYISC